MNKPLKKILLSTLCLTSTATACYGIITLADRNNQIVTKNVCDDEKFLLGGKEEKDLAPSFVELTKWQFANDINPNLPHLSMQRYEEGYNAFVKQHPIVHPISQYLKQVKADEAQYIGSIHQSDLTSTNVAQNNTWAYPLVNVQQTFYSFDPSEIIVLVDNIFTVLETQNPQYTGELSALNSVIDMCLKGTWTDNSLLVKLVDGVCLTIEQFAPASMYTLIYLLNTSIDMIILNSVDRDACLKQVNGLIDLLAGQYPDYQLEFRMAKDLFGILIYLYIPVNPTPIPDPSPFIKVIEQVVDKMAIYISEQYPEYESIIQTGKTIIDDILEIDVNQPATVTRVFDAIFSEVSKMVPELSTLCFLINNALDVMISTNFDRIATWNQLDGIITIAESQVPADGVPYLETAKAWIDATCADPVKYDLTVAAIKFFLFQEWQDIRSSEYTAKMLLFIGRGVQAFLAPQDNLWWYGQGGSLHKSGKGHYGYELSQKPNYNGKYDWTEISTGDTIYEEAGVNYLAGHSAMVDGVYYDLKHNEFYVKGIEAYSPDGVMASVWDDDRVDTRDTHIAHVTKADIVTRDSAIDFMYSQLDKSYAFSLNEQPKFEDIKNGTAVWYCSELVNYSYVQAGYDLCDYAYADKIRHHPVKALYYAYSYFSGVKNYHELPGDLNALDVVAVGMGMLAPRELGSSTLIKDYLVSDSAWMH